MKTARATRQSRTEKSHSEMAESLLGWFAEHQREMPWRKTSDPYAIWLSEIMLQQTQVATVIPYYERFLKRFPSVEELASAPLDEVLKLWAGLGYYSRARNLHKGAQTVVERFGGALPRTNAEICEIPGIGAYTAGAILSIAYGLPEPLVDGNVARVFARMFLLKGDWRKNPLKDLLWAQARGMQASLANVKAVAANPSGDLNQALMELGATVCAPQNPQCLLCPVARHCAARAKGLQQEYPEVPAQKKSPVWNLTAWLVTDAKGRTLFAQRGEEGLFGGLWEVPMERAAKRVKAERTLRHILSHRELRIGLLRAEGAWPHTEPGAFPAWSGSYTRYRWLPLKDALAGEIALASVQRKLLEP